MANELGVGTGPGVITPDGCAVDFYAQIPAMGEPAIIHAAVAAGASILELGCGTGRLMRPLAELGHLVVGVDESPDMLARIPDLPTVCCQIEGLDLGRTFGAVLLASTMINSSPATRREFLAACRRHVDSDGVVVFQQHSPSWFDAVQADEHVIGGITLGVKSVDRSGSRLQVVVEYRVDGKVWTHEFSPHRISGDELAIELGSADLEFGRWLTDDRTWFTAHPLPQ